MITIKSPEEQQKMRVAGRLAAEVLDMIGPHVVPGVTTEELDRLCHDHIVNVQGTIPANLSYRGFPKTICTSVNHVVCHGIPNDKQAQGRRHRQYRRHRHQGRLPRRHQPHVLRRQAAGAAQRLAEVCFEAMWRGIEHGATRARTWATSATPSRSFVEAQDFSVVREYCGHGIGRIYHEDPQVLHYGEPGTGLELQPGMTFTVEPMVNAGKRHVRLLPDGWTVVTKDHSLSAQWEHTVPGHRHGRGCPDPWARADRALK